MSALPWRPIGELPVSPGAGRMFLMIDKNNPWFLFVLECDQVRWSDSEGCYAEGHAEVLSDFTHFIEITPP